MGQRGPKPTPTPLLKLRGSWRGEIRNGEPEATPELPACPAWVSPKAKRYWREVGEMLAGLGVMAKPHTVALALLSDALADWVALSRQARKTDYVVTTDNGAFVHPIHGMKGKAWDRVLKALREFGMTPSAITSVRSVKEETKDKGIKSLKLA